MIEDRGTDEEGEAEDEVDRAGGAVGRLETRRAGGRRLGGSVDSFDPGSVGLRPTLRVVSLTQPTCCVSLEKRVEAVIMLGAASFRHSCLSWAGRCWH